MKSLLIIAILTLLLTIGCSCPECPECPDIECPDIDTEPIVEAINNLELECPECPEIECPDIDMTEVVEAIENLELGCPECPDYEFPEYERVLDSNDVYSIIRNYWEYDIGGGWIIDTISSTYLGNGNWESRVKFRSNINLVRYFYFNEITGRIR